MADLHEMVAYLGGAVSQIDRLNAENGRLRAAMGASSTRLKLLYMAAGLGEKKGLDALAELSAVIKEIDAALGLVEQTMMEK